MRYSSPPTDYIVKSTYRDSVVAMPHYASNGITVYGALLNNVNNVVSMFTRVPINFNALEAAQLHFMGIANIDPMKIQIYISSIEDGEEYGDNEASDPNSSLGETFTDKLGSKDYKTFCPTIEAGDLLYIHLTYSAGVNPTNVYIAGFSIEFSIKNSY